MEVTISNEKDLLLEISNYIRVNRDRTATYKITLGENGKKYRFKYNFSFPLSQEAANALESFKIEGKLKKYEFDFHRCIFEEDVQINSHDKKLSFYDNCIFEKGTILNGYKGVLTFSKCKFKGEFNAENAILSGKVKFWESEFESQANFRNTTFNELVDFWRATFHKPTIFYKTDFLNTVVFSAATFKENVLFTYTRNEKLMLLRGTKAEKGFDFSLAIMPGKLGLFEFNLEDYKDVKYFTDEDEYEKAVSELAIIPIKNKRETFRILKDILESQKNLSESLKYKAIEKEIYRNELKTFKNNSSLNWWGKLKNWSNNRFERFNLWLNKWSNDHGNSYGRAFFFIIIVGWIFFYCSLLLTDRFYFVGFCRISEWDFSKGFKLYMEYLNPIHKFDYIEEPTKSSAWFYLFDFLGKTFVGYGIYQFIQAFRKYK
ncbi:pentapeptide repeat-containing protein [Flavobacterium sp. RNTU_13]|uniref:pentapeptide repeat-containing protein n=1 Tax=Flavobacterium sp. RNTU_13 TaxID=3375145 RepID=UPI00398617FE